MACYLSRPSTHEHGKETEKWCHFNVSYKNNIAEMMADIEFWGKVQQYKQISNVYEDSSLSFFSSVLLRKAIAVFCRTNRQ